MIQINGAVENLTIINSVQWFRITKAELINFFLV